MGQATTSYSFCSPSPSLSSPHPEHRSALTKHAGWNLCVQVHSSPSIVICLRAGDLGSTSDAGYGSSSDGPIPQLGSSHRSPASRSLVSTRWRIVGPGAGGGVHSLGTRGADGDRGNGPAPAPAAPLVNGGRLAAMPPKLPKNCWMNVEAWS